MLLPSKHFSRNKKLRPIFFFLKWLKRGSGCPKLIRLMWINHPFLIHFFRESVGLNLLHFAPEIHNPQSLSHKDVEKENEIHQKEEKQIIQKKEIHIEEKEMNTLKKVTDNDFIYQQFFELDQKLIFFLV